MQRLLFFIFILSGLSSCYDLQLGESVEVVASGTWKGTFIIDNQKIPILFEVQTLEKDSLQFLFIDGNDTTKADKVRPWGDSLFVSFTKHQKELHLKYNVDEMQGFLFDLKKEEYPIQFYGQFALNNRFPDIRQKPKADLTGNWQLDIVMDADVVEKGQLILNNVGNHVSGTFKMNQQLEISVEGTVQGDRIYLSGFDGNHVCLLSADIMNNEILTKGNLILNNTTATWGGNARAGVVNTSPTNH
jgi:hypothetical protein